MFTGIAVLLAAALVFAYISLFDARKNLRKQKAENDKLVAERKVSQTNIAALLDEKGVAYELIGNDRLSFNTEETRIFIDCCQSPKIKISCGFGLKSCNYDWNCVCKVANNVEEDIMMVKTCKSEDDFVEFYIMCVEHSIGHFTKSLDDYVHILNYAHKQFITKYNEFMEEAQAVPAGDKSRVS